MLNIAVFVSGGGTNLQALIDSEKKGEIKGGKIKLVLSSNSNAFALERAKNAGIKSIVVSRKEFENSKDFDKKILEIMKENSIDLIVLAGFMSIIGLDLINEYKNKIINVHPSLIPAFCGDGFYGLRVHKAALEKGVKVTGATTHFVNEITDGGKILMQDTVKVLEDDTPETLQKRVMEEVEHLILPKTVSLFCQGKLK